MEGRGGEPDAERDENGRKRRTARVGKAAERQAQRDGHAAEQRGRRQCQHDGRHASLRTRRTSVPAAAGSARTIPAMITAQPSQPTAPSRSPASVKPKTAAQTGSSENASARLRRARTPLGPGLDEERERAREDARHDQRTPDRPAVRPRELAGRHRDDEQTDEREDHLDEREGKHVVLRRIAFHQHDLERVDGRAGEHEELAGRAGAVDPREEREADGCERDADPGGRADPRAERAPTRAAASARRTSR